MNRYDHEEWERKNRERELDQEASARQKSEEEPPEESKISAVREKMETRTPRELKDAKERYTRQVISLSYTDWKYTVESGKNWRRVYVGGYGIGYIQGSRGSWQTALLQKITGNITEMQGVGEGTWNNQKRAANELRTIALRKALAHWTASDQLLEGTGDHLIEAEQALGRLSPAQGKKLCERWLEICRRRQS